jgi:drug/metabolite transporter (DMT)-like permease
MATKAWAIALGVVCTAFTSSAQILYKIGAASLPVIFTNWYLLGGLGLYAIGALIFILALRGGEVTVIYPIIATSYIWVTLLSYFILKEASLSTLSVIGISLIFIGVSSIGLAGKRQAAKGETA